MTAVWALDLPTGEKMVLLSLADNANDSGHCWPSMATIAKRAGMTTRGAQKIVQRLCEQGHLTQTIVVGKGANYIVHPRTTFTPERSAPPNEKTHTPERRSDKPSRTIIKDKKATPSHPSVRAKPAFVLPDCISPEAWAGFLEMRKRKRANPTDRAKQLIIEKLAKLSPDGSDCNAILDQSTEHGWTGVFELKGHANGHNGSMGRNDRPRGGVVFNAVRELYAEACAAEAAEAVAGIDGNNRGTGVALQLVAGYRS